MNPEKAELLSNKLNKGNVEVISFYYCDDMKMLTIHFEDVYLQDLAATHLFIEEQFKAALWINGKVAIATTEGKDSARLSAIVSFREHNSPENTLIIEHF